jgi:hypothetical protein
MQVIREWWHWILVGQLALGALTAGGVLWFFGLGVLKGIALFGGSMPLWHTIQDGIHNLWQRLLR